MLCVVWSEICNSRLQRKKTTNYPTINDLFNSRVPTSLLIVCDHSEALCSSFFFWFCLFVSKNRYRQKVTVDHFEIQIRAHPLRFRFADLWQLTLPPVTMIIGSHRFCHFFDAFLYITPRVSVWNDYSPFVVETLCRVIALCTCNFCLLSSFCGFLF